MAKREGPNWGRVPPERRTRWGRFLVWQRYLHDDQTQANVRETLSKMGHSLSPAYYSDMETGKVDPIPDEWQDRFRRLWDAEPEPEPETQVAAGPDLAALIASNKAVVDAVDSQTQELERVWRSITDLAAAIRESRLDPGDLAEAIGGALQGVIQPLGGTASGDERSGSDAPRPGRGRSK